MHFAQQEKRISVIWLYLHVCVYLLCKDHPAGFIHSVWCRVFLVRVSAVPPHCQNSTVKCLKYNNVALFLTEERENIFSLSHTHSHITDIRYTTVTSSVGAMEGRRAEGTIEKKPNGGRGRVDLFQFTHCRSVDQVMDSMQLQSRSTSLHPPGDSVLWWRTELRIYSMFQKEIREWLKCVHSVRLQETAFISFLWSNIYQTFANFRV